MDLNETSAAFHRLLGTRTPPVAITFTDTPPPGVDRIPASAPAGCSYWKLAADGEVFWTEPSDHHGCPVGSHTHNVPMPAEVAEGLQGLVGTMVQLQYLKPTDVPQIPTRTTPLRHAVYAPLDRAPVAPDVVLVRGTARQMMLLAEAAESAGIAGTAPALGRPTCAVIPQAINSARTGVSFGCIGNRVYTDAPDDESYFAIPGAALPAITAALAIIANANAELEKFHRSRLPA